MAKYQGKLTKTGKWIEADNVLFLDDNNTIYLFSSSLKAKDNKLEIDKLTDFKIYSNTFGLYVGKDINNKNIYTGDKVEVYYYDINDACKFGKKKEIATVIYDDESKIYYMRADNKKVFLFAGDTQHMISSISKIKNV